MGQVWKYVDGVGHTEVVLFYDSWPSGVERGTKHAGVNLYTGQTYDGSMCLLEREENPLEANPEVERIL